MTNIKPWSSREKRMRKHNSSAKARHRREEERDALIETVDPKARPPLSFAWWSLSFQIMWLKDHQRKNKNANKRK